MVKSPRKRTGPAIPNRAALESSATRAKSAEKYMSASAQAQPPVATKRTPEKKPHIETKPAAAKPPQATQSEHKPAPAIETPKVAAKDSARKAQSFAVRILPAQDAQIEQIAKTLGVDRPYMVRVLRTQTVAILSEIRDTQSWAKFSDLAKDRLSEPKGEGAQFFRTGLQMTEIEIGAAQQAINDPLGMIMPHAVLSAFAKVAFGEALDKLAEKANG